MKPVEQQQAFPREFEFIAAEVDRHGLYTVKLDTYIVEASNRDEIAEAVNQVAKQAQLRVRFDFNLGECVFERKLAV